MSLSETISFNSITLQSVIADAHVLDIQIYAVPLDLTTVSRAYGPGSILTKKRDEARTVEIEVELPVDYRDGIATQYNALRSWADSDEPCALILPNSVGTLYAMLTDMTELSMASWYAPIVLTFTAFDPYFYGDEESASLKANTATSITVGGDVPVAYSITATVSSSTTSPTWSFDGEWTIALSGSVGAGTLIIDTETGLITLNGDSINSSIDMDSRFERLTVGDHTVTSSIVSTITWQEAYR